MPLSNHQQMFAVNALVQQSTNVQCKCLCPTIKNVQCKCLCPTINKWSRQKEQHKDRRTFSSVDCPDWLLLIVNTVDISCCNKHLPTFFQCLYFFFFSLLFLFFFLSFQHLLPILFGVFIPQGVCWKWNMF